MYYLVSFLDATHLKALAKKRDPNPKAFAEFLKTIGLERFADDVVELEVKGHMIVGDRGEEVMEELKMNAIDRLRVSVLYRRRLLGQESELARGCPVERVVKFFEQHKVLKKSAKMIQENGIDGEMLLQATQAAVMELGITAIGWGVIEDSFNDFAVSEK